jgi:hypothetical protein
MSKIRIALVSALAIASLLAGGTAAHAHSSVSSQHRLAGPVGCCFDEGAAHV